MKRIALLGCGNVGRRVAELLLNDADRIARQTGVRLQLARIFVREPWKDRGLDGDTGGGTAVSAVRGRGTGETLVPQVQSLFTNRIEDILEDDQIDAAIEVLGGLEPAASIVERLLARGVSVVTANKTLIAHRGAALRLAASRSGTQLACEASVGSAVPILAALRGLAGDRVRSIRGIINGSTNFILSSIARKGCDFRAALDQATSLGLVEPDPSADLSGRDAAEKLCILADAIGVQLRPDDVQQRGIESIGREDLAAAKRWGWVVKPLAELEIVDGAVEARVGPVLLSARHPLANVSDEQNAVLIDSDLSGELLLRGRGAGPGPTAATIIGDLLQVLRLPARAQLSSALNDDEAKPEFVRPDEPQAHFVRVFVSDSHRDPDQVIQTLRSYGIALKRIEIRRGEALLLTRPSDESRLRRAIEAFCDPSKAGAFIVPYIEQASGVIEQAEELFDARALAPAAAA